MLKTLKFLPKFKEKRKISIHIQFLKFLQKFKKILEQKHF